MKITLLKVLPATIFYLYTTTSILLYAQRGFNPVISPEVQEDKSVIFRLYAPEAKSVKLFGTWMSDIRSEVEMTRNDTGLYVIKVGPLTPDMYVYKYIVNEIRILDPNNPVVVRDGSYIESRLMIPGERTELYDVKNVPHGRLSIIWYPSPTLGMDRRMIIYTPPDYENGNESYPVLYLLHGGGGDEEGWTSRGRANYILDNMIAAGRAKPMLVVMTNGLPTVAGAPGNRPIHTLNVNTRNPGTMITGKFEQSLVKDIIPYIENNYRVTADPDYRAIAGFSMGGYHTQKITNANPGKFNYIGVWSMGLYSNFGTYNKDDHVAQLKVLKESSPKVYWIGCGKEDFLYKGVTDLRALYDELGFDYIYRESEGGHSWNNWRLYLSEFVQLLFK